VLAAGYTPVDLNNVLVSDQQPEHLVAIAERAGFPLNCCSWIKGIYGVVMEKGIDEVICVTTGDCSNTVMLAEVLKHRELKTITFAYPGQPDVGEVETALEGLAAALGTTIEAAEKVREKIRPGRELTTELDRLTWEENRVSGFENHLWLVSSSDFNQDYDSYCQDVTNLITEAKKRRPYPQDELRLAYIGVPSVFAKELYPYLEKCRARAVFNEVQRQFAMPEPGSSLAEQYANYTYPYSINGRIADIRREIRHRRIDGIIHYVQAFCHRGIGDVIFRETLGLPILTLEGNDNFFLTNHVETRIEAFIDVLERRRGQRKGAAPAERRSRIGRQN
jgi:benzoyl-CoA reductase/2-hydroxyglutaryl-CoA dehydratase subunit BcrC/BadD/HgdB